MKTSKITALVIAGLTATTIAGVALAEGPGGMGMMRGGPMAGLDFAAVDADKDGKITVAEMTAHRAARFAAADTDKDGKLNEAELAAMMLAQAEARIKAGSARMLAYMEAHPPTSVAQRRRVVSAFLDKFARPEKLNCSFEMPGWDAELVAQMTAQYDGDCAYIATLPGVTFLTP